MAAILALTALVMLESRSWRTAGLIFVLFAAAVLLVSLLVASFRRDRRHDHTYHPREETKPRADDPFLDYLDW